MTSDAIFNVTKVTTFNSLPGVELEYRTQCGNSEVCVLRITPDDKALLCASKILMKADEEECPHAIITIENQSFRIFNKDLWTLAFEIIIQQINTEPLISH